MRGLNLCAIYKAVAVDYWGFLGAVAIMMSVACMRNIGSDDSSACERSYMTMTICCGSTELGRIGIEGAGARHGIVICCFEHAASSSFLDTSTTASPSKGKTERNMSRLRDCV
jgi:hypothetical protein